MSNTTRPRLRAGHRSTHRLAAVALAAALLGGCQRGEAPAPAGDVRPATPVATVEALADRLQAGDLAGYARLAVPPALQEELEASWREDRSRWPLSGLPMAGRISPLLATFAAEGAEADLRAAFQRQFAGAERELDAAAESLALFGVEYVTNEGDFSDAERAHYAQVIEALGAWAVEAPLADPALAEAAITRLAAASRATKLDEPADFVSLGMAGSLERLQPFFAAAKRTLAGYGLDLDASLAALQAEQVSLEGDTAVVRIRYPLGPREVTAEMVLERVDGQWYPVDSMRNARASLAVPPGAAGTVEAAGEPR